MLKFTLLLTALATVASAMQPVSLDGFALASMRDISLPALPGAKIPAEQLSLPEFTWDEMNTPDVVCCYCHC